MEPARPALVVRLSLQAADGRVLRRDRLCWGSTPSTADLVRELARRSLGAKRDGHRVVVDQAPPEVRAVLALAGLGSAVGADALG